jgi:peptidyl-prolyl cis-trans isomerase D
MISWIQITFQKHFRVFFAVLLVFIIVSFVIYFAPGMGIGMGSTPRVQPRPFFGVNLSSEEDSSRLFNDAGLSVFLQAGYPALEQDRMQEYALMRHAGLHLARQLNLPAPTESELSEFIRTLGAFTGAQGEFDATRYQQFRDNLKGNPQLSEGDVSRVIADDLRYQRVQRLLAGPGYVLPSEVKAELARAETSWTLAVAELDYTAFAPTLSPSEADLTKFFEDNAFRYEIPARVSALYVEFPAAAYASQVSLTDDEVRAYYQANSFRFPKPENAPAITAGDPSDADFLAVRPQVESALRLERARQLAASAASDLSVALFENKVPMSGVGAFLAARNLSLQPLPPFGADSVPPQLGGNPQIAAEALRLNANRHFTDALPTPNGSAVLFWQETIPSRTPEFAEVRERVRADVLADEKRKRFIEQGRAVREAIASRLKSGESFEQAAVAAAEAAGLKATTKNVAAFTAQNPPADLNQAAFGALESLDQGGVSEMILSGNTGLLVHAVTKQLPDVSEANPQYATLRGQIAQFAGARNASEYLRELVDNELASTAPVNP